MGYRLEISEPKCIFYKTKLYGYVDIQQCISIHYLLSLGVITPEDVENDVWSNGASIPIVLTIKQFRQFFKYYNDDCKRLRNYDESLLDDESIKYLFSKFDWELVVLSWG